MFRKKLILWNRIRVHLPKYQTAACILIICSFLSSLLAMIPPYLFSILINSVIGQKKELGHSSHIFGLYCDLFFYDISGINCCKVKK